jgi:hypothetical protein
MVATKAGADIGPDEWITLTLTATATATTAAVDGVTVLTITRPSRPWTWCSRVFVDIGTEAYFANLRIQHAE